jgi:TolB protein
MPGYSNAMRLRALVALGAAIGGCRAPAATPAAAPALLQGGAVPYAASPAEPHLLNLRMLTSGGENAEAYFSADGRQLIFQATRPGVSACDQIFIMDADGRNVRMVSTGKGKTTCAYFFPSGQRILYSSTHERAPDCPPPPDYSQGYVWPLDAYDIYTARPDGSDLRRLTNTAAYDAEATISADGRRIVFTSARDGDLDIYTMDADGSNVRRLTDRPGYDGGAFFSADGSQIVYRARHPETPEELADYRRLLGRNLIRPTVLDIYVMNADGSNQRRLTGNGAANFAPFFHPDGRRIIFSSNLHDPGGRNFDLYLINVDGTGLERVTEHAEFDGFPMFSRDGARLVFASNRGAARRGDTNVFIADWKN